MRAIHRSKKAVMSVGPSRSQMACSRSEFSTVAKPLANSVKPIPALRACRFARS
jgi:hypothetical protein